LKKIKLNKLLEEIQRTKIVEGDNLVCKVCGRRVKVMETGKGPLICCGKHMKIY
jgi:desulfoferrodoxin-like iron-binding protein